MGKIKNKYAELAMYSPKITKQDYEGIFERFMKTGVPLFEWLDFSGFINLKGINILLQRHNNTIKMYVEDNGGVYSQSALLFPFRMNEPDHIQRIKGFFTLQAKFVGNTKLFDFLIKENVQEIKVKIFRLFGKLHGVGMFINNRDEKGALFLSDPSKFLEIDLENNPVFYVELLDPIPKAVYVTSDAPLFEQNGVQIGLDNFSALQHSLIVGTSGTGKSRLIEIMVKAVKKTHPEARILIIDPHNEFSKSFTGEKVVDFVHNYIEPFDVGLTKSPLVAQLVAQLITSTIGQENKYAERIVFYAVHLLASINQLSLTNLNALLTDSSKRMEFSSKCENDEVRRFFDEEFQDIYMHHFNDAILPVINFIGEYLLYMGENRKLEDLGKMIQDNQVSVISFNPHFFGRRIIKFFAGAIINQMYIMAISEKLDKPTIVIVDEFPTVETKVVKDILAETRKFNLYMHVSAQYLGQISPPVLNGIISNVRNIISFKVTKEDAKLLSSMMEIKVEEFFKKRVSPSELEESKKEMFVKLHPRECIVRLFDGVKYILPMKVKTADVSKWA